MIDVEVSRRYLFSQEELKKILKMTGDIVDMGLWSGKPPSDTESEDDAKVFYINTIEKKQEEVEKKDVGLSQKSVEGIETLKKEIEENKIQIRTTDKRKDTLKNVRIGRAEDLDEATRKKYNLPDSGIIVIENREVDK